MQCAGFNHPDRVFPPNRNADVLFDGGPYFSSAPLRAEMCIGDIQSDTSCINIDGTCILLRPPEARITNIVYDPPGSDVEGENVIIVNPRTAPLTMTNCTLRDESNHIFTFPSFILAGGAQVRIWTKSGVNDDSNLYWRRRQAVWNNPGDRAF
jgi:hypothetical protein